MSVGVVWKHINWGKFLSNFVFIGVYFEENIKTMKIIILNLLKF